jgi:hypothetical protein
MSIYAYWNCHDCRQAIWLGKVLHSDFKPICFHIGGEEEAPHWQRPLLNQVIWKFLADHAGHHTDVRLEHEMTDEMFGYKDIGGDRDTDISYEQYVDGWLELHIGKVAERA